MSMSRSPTVIDERWCSQVSWQQNRTSNRPPCFEIAMRARCVGERIALLDRDALCAALKHGEQICGALQHFAARVQIVRESGTGHIQRAHPVETEQIEWRNQPTRGPI